MTAPVETPLVPKPVPSWLARLQAGETLVDRSTGHAIVRCGGCKGRWRVSFERITRTTLSHRGPVAKTSILRDGAERETLLDTRRTDPVAWALWTACPTCTHAQRLSIKVVKGTVTSTACGDKCMSAVGPSCECACGGENHGAAHGSL